MQNPLLEYKYCPKCSKPFSSEKENDLKEKKCSNCGFTVWANPKPTVTMLLVRDGKVLMLQRAQEPLKNYWVLPGGFVNYEESSDDAVVREVEEEIGFKPSSKELLGVYHIDNDPRGMHIDIIYYGTVDGEIKISKEHSQFKFYSVEDLPDQIAFKHREAIMDWAKKNT